LIEVYPLKELIRIDNNLVPAAAASSARAFENDPYTVYAIPDKKKRANLKFAFEFYMRFALYEGAEGYTTSRACEGVAIWSNPEKKLHSPGSFLHSGNPFLPLRCGFRYVITEMRLNNFCDKIKKQYAPKSHLYLALLAVDPVHQKKGIASALVKPLLKECDLEGLPCYLETQNENNVAMYNHFGFEKVYQGIFPGTPTPLFVMLRKPNHG
jgi:GNAT superfamily N-acetyltransferase